MKRSDKFTKTGLLSEISRRLDLWLICTVIIMIIMGCLMIFSAVHKSPDKMEVVYHNKQITFAIIGFLFMVFMLGVNYQLLEEYAWPLYLGSLFLLILVLILGKTVHGAKSWFAIGGMGIQPSEFAKIALIIILSKFLARRMPGGDLRGIGLIVPVILALIPMGLIILQPDMGSTFVFVPLLLGILYLGNVRPGYIFSFLGFSGIAMGIPLFLTYAGKKQVQHGKAVQFFNEILHSIPYTVLMIIAVIIVFFIIFYIFSQLRFNISLLHFITASGVFIGGVLASYPMQLFLKEYQKERLVAFINPNIDPLGTGYHIIQSQVAVGSGGFIGKGFLQGTQGQLGFLPVQHTDFIFSIIAEEFGLLGAIFIIIMFNIILFRGIKIAMNARDSFGSILAGGIVWLFFVEIVINLGVTVGLMPVMGVSLPFLSYGGSSLISSMVAVGILLNIHNRRFTH